MRGRDHVAVILLTWIASTPGGAHALPAADEEWIRVTSKNFSIVSNAKSGKAREIALELERFRAVVRGDVEEMALPTTIVVFKNEKAHEPYKLNDSGKPANIVGQFASTREGNYIGVDADAGGEPFGTIYHEYTHFLLSQAGYVPLWLNEGRAEFYTTFWADDERAEIGTPVVDHVDLLKAHGFMALPQLFTITTDSETYNEGARQGIFYAQSWALYHYLTMSGADTRARFDAFVARLQVGGESVNGAFAAAFGKTYGTVEDELRAYVHQGRFTHEEYDIAKLHADAESLGEMRVERMAYADVLYTLGDYLLQVTPWRADDAEAHQRAAIRVQPGHARAHAALARILDQRGQTAEAKEHYEKAIDLDVNDYVPYFAYGAAMVDRFVETVSEIPLRPTQLPEPLLEARARLGRCVELQPTHGDAYLDLGITYLFDPAGASLAIGALQQAVGLMPARMDAVYYLVLALLQAGDRATAQELCDVVLGRWREREWQKRAEAAIAASVLGGQSDRYRSAVDAFNSGEFSRAIEIADELLAEVKDLVMTRELQRLRIHAQEQLQEREWHDRYSDAVDRTNAGDYAGAIAILETLTQDAAGTEIGDLARTLLGDIRKATRR